MIGTSKGYVCVLLGVSLTACKQQGESASSSMAGPPPTASAASLDSPQIEALKRKGVQGQALDDIRKLQRQVKAKSFDGDRAGNDFFYAGMEEAQVAAFLQTLKDAVARNDRPKVAFLVQYPTMVSLNGRGQPFAINDPETFVKNYDAIMNKRVLAALKEAEVSNLFANSQGVSIGRGEIWFSGLCENGQLQGCREFVVRITKINNHPLP
jgi:hypothetical protein